jgi:predicted hydrocarbon binding protein
MPHTMPIRSVARNAHWFASPAAAKLRRHHARDSLVNARPRAGVPAALPLALLEALRASDAPRPDTLDEHPGEMVAKRLGLSRTVEAQIHRLEKQARQGRPVPGAEFAALQRLVARRPDAGVVFSDAGRRAARRVVRDRGGAARALTRPLPAPWRRTLGFRLARRLAVGTFGVQFDEREGGMRAELGETLAVVTDPGPACSFMGSALAEMLRLLAGFDGAMVHVACRARGAGACAWSAAPPEPRS